MEVLTGKTSAGAWAHSKSRGKATARGGIKIDTAGSVVLRVALALLTCMGPVGSLTSHADNPPHTEYEVKAAFLLNFAKFVEWPPESLPGPDTPIVIGVLGQDPFGSLLDDTVKGQTVGDREVRVKRSGEAQGLKDCHIVFISSSEDARLKEVLETFKGSSVLTVGDMENFAGRGGIISLVKEKGKIRFDVNTDAAKNAKLKIGSQLLNLARTVVGKGDERG